MTARWPVRRLYHAPYIPPTGCTAWSRPLGPSDAPGRGNAHSESWRHAPEKVRVVNNGEARRVAPQPASLL